MTKSTTSMTKSTGSPVPDTQEPKPAEPKPAKPFCRTLPMWQHIEAARRKAKAEGTFRAQGSLWWTPLRVARLKKLLGQGMSVEEITERMGAQSKAAVYGATLRYKLTPRQDCPRWSAEHLATVQEMWGNGASAEAITRAVGGRNCRQVYAIVRRCGYKRLRGVDGLR